MPPMRFGLAALSFIVCVILMRVLLSRFGRFALDHPNARSLHQRPVPRTGGIAILAGVSVALAFGAAPLAWLLGIVLALAAVSFLDDLYGMSTLARLLLHLVAAGVTVWYLVSPVNLAGLAALALAVAWIINLYNFMDGSDGLAGGMSVIGFAAYASAALLAGDAATAALCIAIAAASAGFLVYNLHPARVFLGDVGSIPLGYCAGALGVLGWRNDVWPLWFPLLVFAPFIGDATLTLAKRVLRRERVWEAHKEHYYQRLVRMGLGHRGTAYVAYAIMLLCAGAALFGREQPLAFQLAVLGGTICALAAVAVWVDLRWLRFQRDAGAA
jgi:UDP-N-acetylmuramyl pentapeptide phosphotransferase/UDP-N-acetylglucosamine-1-phosphate transferase